MIPSIHCGSHLKPLLQAVLKTHGDVLELGAGVFSTPVLHWLCELRGRRLVTLEGDLIWAHWAGAYATRLHQIIPIIDWDAAPLEGQWDVVLVDHAPGERRAREITRLAQCAHYILAHDAEPPYLRQYGYETVFPEFQYGRLYNEVRPATMILSNCDNLEIFWSL